jgi:hypothetical protein
MNVTYDPATDTARVSVCRLHPLVCETSGLDLAEKQMASIIAEEFEAAGMEGLAKAAIVNAYGESHLDPGAMSPSGASVGLFQLHENGLGHGMTVAQRKDPVVNTRKVIGEIRSSWGRSVREAVARGAPLEDLVALFARDVMRPQDRDRAAAERVEMARKIFPPHPHVRSNAPSPDVAKVAFRYGATPRRARYGVGARVISPVEAEQDIVAAYGIPGALARAIVESARRIPMHPYDLANVIRHESKFDPQAQALLPPGSPFDGEAAVGLIQLNKQNAAKLGTSLHRLWQMSAVEQMPYVEDYFRREISGDNRWGIGGAIDSGYQTAMTVFFQPARKMNLHDLLPPDVVKNNTWMDRSGRVVSIRTPYDYMKMYWRNARLPDSESVEAPRVSWEGKQEVAVEQGPETEVPWAESVAETLSSLVYGSKPVWTGAEGFLLVDARGETWPPGEVEAGVYSLTWQGQEVTKVNLLEGQRYEAVVRDRRGSWGPV